MRIIEAGILLSLVWASQPAAGQTSSGSAIPAFAATDAGQEQAEFRTLDEDIQDLKTLVMDLNRDLFLLEEELLFPANTQVAVYVSMDVGEFFDLDSVQIKLNDRDVANYLYTSREVDALIRGGVHQLYLGNMKAGEHELIAIFTGQGPHERDYRRGATVVFDKGIGPKYIELSISDREQALQPEFVVTEWD
ncbi:MAG: AraC family transcriptional regulator [Gammaproteobacteria bacterium]